MIVNKQRIGIQFNIDDSNFNLKKTITQTDVEITSDHINIFFTKKELKKIDPKKDSNGKISLMRSYLRKFLEHSSYTNIYTSIDAKKLSNIKDQLLDHYFTSQNKSIRIEKVSQKNSFIENFEEHIDKVKVINLVKTNPIIKVIDTIYREVHNRNYALDQELSIELLYEDKEEWGLDFDALNLSIQVEKKEE
jgi:hypothetical protein